jgi:hypothetical protein
MTARLTAIRLAEAKSLVPHSAPPPADPTAVGLHY